MLKLLTVGVIGAIASAIKIPKVRAVGENIQVGGEYSTATNPTILRGDAGPYKAVFECEHTGLSKCTVGIIGTSGSLWGRGVSGYSTAGSGWDAGVWGSGVGPNGVGVRGRVDGGGISVLGEALGSTIPIVARGNTTLQQWQKMDGFKTLSVVDKDGKLGIGTGTQKVAAMIHIISCMDPTTGHEFGPITASSSPGEGPWPNAFIVENTTPGNFKSQFTFRASGANKWSFGNDMNGNGGQNFFIWDEVAAATRLYIDSAGKVGLGTTSPAEKLHVAGKVKATEFVTGDITFANGLKATEEGRGLAFLNDEGEKIAVLDYQGNLRIKGDVIKDPTL